MSLNVLFARSVQGSVKNIMDVDNKAAEGFRSSGALDLTKMFETMSDRRASSFEATFASMSDSSPKSFHEAAFVDTQPHQTVMDALVGGQGVSFATQATNTASLSINTSMAEGSAKTKMDATRGVQDNNQSTMNKFVTTFKEHQNRASQFLGDAAKSIGRSAGDVLGKFLPQQQHDKATAAFAIISDVATSGAGSLAMAGRVGGASLFAASKFSENRKDMSHSEKKKLIEEVRDQIQQKASQPVDTRAAASNAGAAEAKNDQLDRNLANLNEAKLETLLTTRAEDQKEFKALDNQKADLENVVDSHAKYKDEGIATNVAEFGQAFSQADQSAAAKIGVSLDVVETVGFTVAASEMSSPKIGGMDSGAVDFFKKMSEPKPPEAHLLPPSYQMQAQGMRV